ncbi:MAG: hypothetical protein AB1649_18270 [Chloroflexota bacterium]
MSNRFFRSVIIASLALNVLACSLFTPAPTPSAEEIEQEEQAVYSFFVNEGEGPVLILQNTSTGITDDSQQVSDFVQSGLPSLSKETAAGFMERNKESSQLSPDMELGVDYILLSSEELSRITSQPNWGEVLQQEYPGSYGYTMLSHVGFNKTMDQALIYVGDMAGPLMGAGFYYLLEKVNGEWLLKEQVMVWIS